MPPLESSLSRILDLFHGIDRQQLEKERRELLDQFTEAVEAANEAKNSKGYLAT